MEIKIGGTTRFENLLKQLFHSPLLDHRDPEHFISNKKKCSVIYLVRVCFESFRRDFNEAKAVYIAVIKINVLLFTFVCVCFEYCYLPLSVSFLSRLEGI